MFNNSKLLVGEDRHTINVRKHCLNFLRSLKDRTDKGIYLYLLCDVSKARFVARVWSFVTARH